MGHRYFCQVTWTADPGDAACVHAMWVGVLQRYQLDPEIVPQTPLKVSEVFWSKDNEEEEQQSPVPRDLSAPRGPSAGTSRSAPDLLYEEIAAKAPQAPPLSLSSQLTHPFPMPQHPQFSA